MHLPPRNRRSTARRRPVVGLLAAGVLAGAVGISAASPAGAGGPLPPAGGPGDHATWHIPCTKAPATVVIPPGPATAVVVVAAGASGGAGGLFRSGGPGGTTTAVMPAAPGDTLTVWAGCVGADFREFNGGDSLGGFGWRHGGQGGITPNSTSNGGGGGGASAVERSGHDGWKVVGGGGGGGGGASDLAGGYGGAGGGGGRHPQTGGVGRGDALPGGCGGCRDGGTGGTGGGSGGGGLIEGAGGGGGGGCRGGNGGHGDQQNTGSQGGGGGGGSSCVTGAGATEVSYGDHSNSASGYVNIATTTRWEFGCTGAPETVAIPAGAERLLIDAAGGEGAHTEGSGGGGAGYGGRVIASAPVTGGDAVEVAVGCDGGQHGGYGGGSSGGRGGQGGASESKHGGNGGGATAVAAADASWGVVAGGGGGAGAAGLFEIPPGGTGGGGGHIPRPGTAANPGGAGGAGGAEAGRDGGGGGPGIASGGGGGGGGGGCNGGQGGGGGESAAHAGGGGGGGSSCAQGSATISTYQDGSRQGSGFIVMRTSFAGEVGAAPSPPARPDATLIVADGSRLGDDVYSDDGEGQTETRELPNMTTYRSIVGNDGPQPASMHAYLRESGHGFEVEHRLLRPDGTSIAAAPGFLELGSIAPGEEVVLEMTVRSAGAPVGQTFIAPVAVKLAGDSATLDVVRTFSVSRAMPVRFTG